MNYFKIILIVVLCVNCSRLNRSKLTPQEFYKKGESSVSIYLIEDKWQPESNCKSLGPLKVEGRGLDTKEGFEYGLGHLKQRILKKGGNVGVIRDATPFAYYADTYFCTADYGKFNN